MSWTLSLSWILQASKGVLLRSVIQQLVACHKDNPLAKFWGACNDEKVLLDRCMQEEKKINRGENQKKAIQEKKSLKNVQAAFIEMEKGS